MSFPEGYDVLTDAQNVVDNVLVETRDPELRQYLESSLLQDVPQLLTGINGAFNRLQLIFSDNTTTRIDQTSHKKSIAENKGEVVTTYRSIRKNDMPVINPLFAETIVSRELYPTQQGEESSFTILNALQMHTDPLSGKKYSLWSRIHVNSDGRLDPMQEPPTRLVLGFGDNIYPLEIEYHVDSKGKRVGFVDITEWDTQDIRRSPTSQDVEDYLLAMHLYP